MRGVARHGAVLTGIYPGQKPRQYERSLAVFWREILANFFLGLRTRKDLWPNSALRSNPPHSGGRAGRLQFEVIL